MVGVGKQEAGASSFPDGIVHLLGGEGGSRDFDGAAIRLASFVK